MPFLYIFTFASFTFFEVFRKVSFFQRMPIIKHPIWRRNDTFKRSTTRFTNRMRNYKKQIVNINITMLVFFCISTWLQLTVLIKFYLHLAGGKGHTFMKSSCSPIHNKRRCSFASLTHLCLSNSLLKITWWYRTTCLKGSRCHNNSLFTWNHVEFMPF